MSCRSTRFPFDVAISLEAFLHPNHYNLDRLLPRALEGDYRWESAERGRPRHYVSVGLTADGRYLCVCETRELFERVLRIFAAAELAEKIKNCGRPLQGSDEAFRTAFEFLGPPQKLWLSERIEDKRAVLKLVFASRLAYARNEGFELLIWPCLSRF